jgi:hypothetical protein
MEYYGWAKKFSIYSPDQTMRQPRVKNHQRAGFIFCRGFLSALLKAKRKLSPDWNISTGWVGCWQEKTGNS